MTACDPRTLFMLQPSPRVRGEMLREVVRHGLAERLGAAMFAPENWHQSLSVPQFCAGPLHERFLQAGAEVRANAFTMSLNRIVGDGAHWRFEPRGKPAGLQALLAAVRRALARQGLDGGPLNTPHLTLAYHPPGPLPRLAIGPIVWQVDELLLVEGHGTPYRYEVLGRWPLPGAQAELPWDDERPAGLPAVGFNGW